MMRVAMLGVGHWHAGMHARGVLRAGAEIAGVWDPDVGAVARFIDACGGIARPDAAAVIDDRPDLVIALGRGPAAAAQLSWLIEQDIPILADKPIGVSHADVAPLADATARRNQFVSVALVNRIAGVVEAMHDRGRLVHFYFRIINGHPRRYRDWHVPWMLDPQQSGGGALRNLGVHGVHAFLTFAHKQQADVEHAVFHSLFGEAVEDYAAVALKARDGMVGIIEAGYTHPDVGGSFEMRINGEHGALVDDGNRLVAVPPDSLDRVAYVPSDQRYSAFVADTLARVAAGRPPLVSLHEFASATALVDQCYQRLQRQA
jgi:predicted dehydrogenase